MRISIQEQHLPGAGLEEKWEAALAWGFDAIELRGAGDHGLRARLPELQRAARRGVVMPTVCPEMDHFVGAFDDALRADAVEQLRSQLDVIAELGGTGVMTPAAWGMFSRRLPPFTPPRSPEADREALLDSFGALARHAEAAGVVIMLEPLNRYEDHMVNTLADACSLVDELGSRAFGIVADTFHMNIEEADPLAALRGAGDRLLHVQLSDTNRLEPGAGHLDVAAVLETLQGMGYPGDLAFESRLSGNAAEVLPASVARVRAVL